MTDKEIRASVVGDSEENGAGIVASEPLPPPTLLKFYLLCKLLDAKITRNFAPWKLRVYHFFHLIIVRNVFGLYTLCVYNVILSL